MQRSQKCPVCKTDWTGRDFVGEKAITTSDGYLQGKRRSGAGGGRASNAQSQRRNRREAQGSGSDAG